MREKLRILVVDDDGDVREYLRLWLGQLGHEVLTVGTNSPLFWAWCDGQADLIISDIHLPDLGGLRALEVIRRQTATPAILLSNGWDDAALMRAAGLNRVWCLAKPVRPLELVTVIEQARVTSGLRRNA